MVLRIAFWEHGDTGRKDRSLRLDFAVAGVILMPFVTIALDFRSSLVVQALGILVIVVATLPALTTVEGRCRVLAAPGPVLFGVAAVAAVTFGGAAVGLIRGHAMAQVAGQAFSMGLLPLAAVGGLAMWKGSLEKRWRIGLLAAMTVGCWIQLLWGVVRITVHGEPSRLFLPNAVSVIGPALLGLCFSLVSLRDPHRWMRRLAWLATVSILLVILGSSLRSLWILTPATVIGLVVVWRGLRSRETLIAVVSITLLGAGIMGAGWQLEKWVGRDMPDVLQRTPCSLFPDAGDCLTDRLTYSPDGALRPRFDAPVGLPDGDAWRVVVRGRGEGQGAMIVILLFVDDSGSEVGRIPVPIRAGEESGRGIAVGTVPPGWADARVRLSRWEGSTGHWRLEGVECAVLESPTMVRLAGKALAAKERFFGLVRVAKTGRVDGDATLGFRWYESTKIVEALVGGSWVDRLFGRGLGATIRLDIDGFDNRGHWIHYDDVNYIHNWYLFLLFKLGIVGSILVLGALVGWIAWIVRSFGRAADSKDRAFLVAAAAAWIVYAVWSLTSPEILDFRMAPLWGWLLAVTSGGLNNPGDPKIRRQSSDGER